MEHWSVIEWCAVVGAVAAVAGAVGSSITVFFHGWRARERMFAEINSMKDQVASLKRKVRVLWEIAPMEEKLKRATLTGFEEDDD